MAALKIFLAVNDEPYLFILSLFDKISPNLKFLERVFLHPPFYVFLQIRRSVIGPITITTTFPPNNSMESESDRR